MSRLRIGTYNARFLPHLPSNKRRATVLAQRIARYDYDVIALSEVFSNRARNALLGSLAALYPYNVQYIGSRKWLREDSGLMLFSKLPFDPLPSPSPFEHPNLLASESGLASDWSHVWFVEYDECCSSDCLAGKGAAYVLARLNGRPFHIFFTHMQAKYDFHNEEMQRRTRGIRTAQLRQMIGLMQHVLSGNRASTENVMILGDFNVDGLRSGAETGPDGGSSGSEWSETLGTLNKLFPNGVSDVWDCHTPWEDPGHTYSSRDPQARRDYVLLSSADTDQPLSVQQVSLAHNLAGEEGAAPDPRSGSWRRCYAAGSLLVGTAADSLANAVEVFAASDISRPIRWTHVTEGTTSRNGDLRCYPVTGSCYIRVGDPKGSCAGDYRLTVANGAR
ncbi:MAG: endonuclease/exonuclease/phosphatase family protein [Gemmatimonadales bacterium]